MTSITVKTQIDIRTNAMRAFEIIVPIDLPTIFKGYAFLPAVSGIKDSTGAWDGVGQTRTVCLSDGSTAREDLTAYAPGETFRYTISHFTGSLRYLARSAEGQWWFEPRAKGQCHVRWHYTFRPVSIFAYPILWCVARIFWAHYMKNAVTECKMMCEA